MSLIRRWYYPIALALILFIGFALRTFNVDWADGQLPHPDERSTIAFYAPTIKWPSEPGTFFDPRRSTLNPLWDVQANHRRSYTYGHFPLYLLVAAGHLTVKLAPVAEAVGVSERIVDMMRIADGSPGYAWVGRVLMALADTLTLFYLYLLGKRMWNKKVGLLAAALGAFTVTQIQLAHFFAVDPISTTFTVAAVYHAIRMVDTGGWKQTVLTGVMAALAIASKFSAVPILAAPGMAGLIIAWQQQRGERKGTPGILLGAAAIVIAFVVFALTSPFVFLDFENFNQAVIKEQGAMVRGEADFPFTRQYRGTTPYLYFIRQQVQWGMGWLLGLVGWLAFGWALVRVTWRRTRPSELIVLSWLVPYFGITGAFLAKFNRYMMPVVPFLSVLGAGMLWSLAWWWVRRRQAPPYELPSGPPAQPVSAPVDAERPPAQARVIDLTAVSNGEEGVQEIVGEPLPSQAAEPQSSLTPASSVTQPPATIHPGDGHRLFAILAMIVLIPTVLWALAFVNGVYRTEHPFITASKWMYENIPDGSVWITEHWEEGMPLNLPIPNGYPGAHGWRNVVMPMYEEDTAQKYQIIKQNMREGNYYVLATKRLYGALPHLPERYPMSVRFYKLLFSGQLGYELVGDFHTYPKLFGIEINDQNADESFWVYDHPRTLIYRKVRDLSDAEWDQLLAGSWETAIPGYTGQRHQNQSAPPVREAKTGPTLLLEQPVDELPSVGRVDWNPLRDHSWLMLIFWWIVLALVQVLAWPVAFAVFSNLRDRGYGLSRALGLILVAWVSWMLPSLHLLKNNLLPTFLGLLILLGLAVLVWQRQRQEMLVFMKAHRPLLLFSEALFAAAFLFFVFIRLLNPDLWQPWQGGEKLMEFAFLNAVLRTPYFPPYDPYFAGGYINYYYYGYQILASLFKLTGVRPSLGFNLAIPTLFALTASGVFSLVYSLMPRQRHLTRGKWWRRGLGAGLLGVFFVVLMGNLDGGLIVLRQIAEQSHSTFTSHIPLLEGLVRVLAGLDDVLVGKINLPAYNFWTPSRVIPFTINEFPFWSYLFADLHPHMMGIPFTVLFMALSYNLVATYGRSLLSEGRLAGMLALLAMPLTLGAIGVINTWDMPTYLGIGVLAWGLREWKSYSRIRLLPTALFVAALAGLAYLFYRPFFSHYTTVFNTGVGLTYAKTSMGVWLRIWGLFMFITLSYAWLELRYAPGDVPGLRWFFGLMKHFDRAPRYLDQVQALVRPAWDMSLTQALLGGSVLVGILLVWLGYSVIALTFVLVVWIGLLLFRRSSSAEAQFRAMLFFTGVLILLGVEVFYLKDFLCGCGEGLFSRQHGDYYRMNTLFKFYTQVWVMLGVAAAASLPALWERIQTWRPVWRWGWTAVLGVLLALGLVFPIWGTSSRVNDRFPGPRPPRTTLDGMAFMSVGEYSWPTGDSKIMLKYDYEAIRWLLDHVQGTPVVAEAPASWYPVNGQNVGYDYYRAGGLRVSSFTGLPTFLGQHQGEQRFNYLTSPREQTGREFWETTDIARLRQIIDELHVDYVYVGQLERTLFNEAQLSKFDVLISTGEAEIVFENPGVKIYRLLR